MLSFDTNLHLNGVTQKLQMLHQYRMDARQIRDRMQLQQWDMATFLADPDTEPKRE